VFLTYDNERREPIIFALADVGAPREDIANEQGDASYARCGWVAQFPASKFPSYLRVTTINAWTLDTETGRACKLEGGITIQPP
jgi:hypothetical protein